MKGKRFLAFALSAAMVAGGSTVAFAADQEGGEQGSGEVQYVATSDVFSVVLPTEKAEGAASTFDYLLDPDGLIAATKDQTDKRYEGVFEDGKTLYFKHATQVGGKDYTDTSDELKVTNKSTSDVELSVTAKVAAADGVTMDADGTFAAATGAGNLYLALVGKCTDDASDTTTPITADGVKVDITIPKDTAAYEVKWNATDKQYEKALTTAAQADGYAGFKSYTFKLTGACKANDAALTALKENPPKVDLTWSVKDFTVTGPQITMTPQGLVTVTNLTADQNYASIKLTLGDDSEWDINADKATWNDSAWSASTGGSFTVQLGESWLNFIVSKGGTAEVVLNLTDGTSKTINVTIPQS